jgi:hypothetical protein
MSLSVDASSQALVAQIAQRQPPQPSDQPVAPQQAQPTSTDPGNSATSSGLGNLIDLVA